MAWEGPVGALRVLDSPEGLRKSEKVWEELGGGPGQKENGRST